MLAVELRPPEQTFRVTRARHTRRWAVAIAIALCPLALTLTVDWFQHADLRARLDEKTRAELQLVTVRERFKFATAEAEQLLAQIQRADALRAKRAWSDLLSLIGQAVPPNGWLTTISTEPAAPSGVSTNIIAPTPPTTDSTANVPKPPVMIESPRELRISGYAVAAAEPSDFVTGLRGSNIFTKVELIQVRQEPIHDGSYYKFDIVCKW